MKKLQTPPTSYTSHYSTAITWDAARLKRFRQAYADTDTKGFDDSYVFEFEGHEFVRGYAKYLLEYLGNAYRGY